MTTARTPVADDAIERAARRAEAELILLVKQERDRFTVSGSKLGSEYLVDVLDIDPAAVHVTCSCEGGRYGLFCKHMYVVLERFCLLEFPIYVKELEDGP